MFYLFYWHASFFAFIMPKQISATYAFHMCVGYDKTKQTPSNKIWYDIYIRQILYKNTCLRVLFLVWKNACLNYCEFDLEGDLVGVPHTWYLSAQSFNRLLKLVLREYDIVAMNEWKTKCVGLQRTWVSKRTVGVAMEAEKKLCVQLEQSRIYRLLIKVGETRSHLSIQSSWCWK